MLIFSPLFGAIWSTIIMLIYASIEANINIKEIGTILKVVPLTFLFMAIISYVLYVPLKFIFLRENIELTNFKEMWKMFFVMLFSVVIGSLFGLLSYYFEGLVIKAFVITLALSCSSIFTYSFHVSLRKQLAKK